MANWQGAKVTNKGTALIAKVTAGNTKLNITRVAFGSGNLTNIENATRLVREIDNAEIITKVQKNNTCTVTVRLTNANFTTAQNISEIGILPQIQTKAKFCLPAWWMQIRTLSRLHRVAH